MIASFTPKDQDFIRQRGGNVEDVTRQFGYFEKGFDFADLQRAATVGDGIIRLKDSEIKDLLAAYPTLLGDKKAVKFVPASGAASRMFKEVFSYLENEDEATRKKATPSFTERLCFIRRFVRRYAERRAFFGKGD